MCKCRDAYRVLEGDQFPSFLLSALEDSSIHPRRTSIDLLTQWLHYDFTFHYIKTFPLDVLAGKMAKLLQDEDWEVKTKVVRFLSDLFVHCPFNEKYLDI